MHTFVQSPVGQLRLESNGEALTGLFFEGHIRDSGPVAPAGTDAILGLATRQIQEYFEAKRKAFDLPLAPEGTDFQKRVWQELQRIPFGDTISYGELARRMGDVNAVRAVASANGRNPISIIVPCHRVIAADGSPHGYGGGIERKVWLLGHEQPRLF